MTAHSPLEQPSDYAGSRQRYRALVEWLASDEALALSSAEVEARLEVENPALLAEIYREACAPPRLRSHDAEV